MIFPVKRLVDLGFEVIATEGTAHVLRRNGVDSTLVPNRSDCPELRLRESSTARSTW